MFYSMAETNVHTNLVNVFTPVQKRHLSPGLALKQHWFSHTSWMFFVVSGEHQPSMSTDSDTSLIMPVELVLSGVELQSDPEQDNVKSWSAINGAGAQQNDKRTRAKQHRCTTSSFDLMVSITAKKNGSLVLFLWLYCIQCLLSWACVTRLEKPHGPTKDVSGKLWLFQLPYGKWASIHQDIPKWICNASICFECLKRFACALTSSSYGPVSDAPCEVSPVLIVCWTLFLHLQICDVSNHATGIPETQLMTRWVFQQPYPVMVCHGSVCESQCHKRRYFPLILSWLSAVICSARPHAHC